MVKINKELVYKLRTDGLSRSEIAQTIGCSNSGVGRYIKGTKLSQESKNRIRKKVGYSRKLWLITHDLTRLKDKKIKAIEMRMAGKTQPEIVATLQIGKGTASGWLRNVPVPHWYNSEIKNKRTDAARSVLNRPDQIEKRNMLAIQRRAERFSNLPENQMCTVCKRTMPISFFGIRKSGHVRTWCHDCTKEYGIDRRIKAMKKLSGNHIICECGCDILDIMEIHHINGDGQDERRLKSYSKFIKDILELSYEQSISRYSILCKVCHMAKHSGQNYVITWKPLNIIETNTYVTKRCSEDVSSDILAALKHRRF